LHGIQEKADALAVRLMQALAPIAALLCGCNAAKPDDPPNSAPRPRSESPSGAGIPEELRHLPKPASALADRIDAALSENRCVDGIDKWERAYSFRDSDAAGRKLVDFVLFEADGATINAGRVLLPPGGRTDERRGRIVTGSYSVSTAQLDIEACGIQN
jgi:hypothetical protein